jgi:uncharacterized protein (DUF58 family)
MSGSLVPAMIEAPAEPNGNLPFAFAPRFFVFLLIGLVWLVLAWWSPRLIVGLFVWDLIGLAAWLYDLRRLPASGQLEARRVWNAPLLLARTCKVSVELQSPSAIRVALVDETPVSVRDEPPALAVTLVAGETGAWQYEIRPGERGDIRFGNVFLRYRSGFGFAERWAVARLAQTVRVLPDLVEARDQALYLIRSKQIEMEKRRRKQRGVGREFESLREYREGDDLRDVYWPATARRHQLTTRSFESERSQMVWIVVDAGRLLRARVLDPSRPMLLSKLDYAVNAALSLAQVASQTGDRVGLVAYGRAIQQAVASGRGPLQIRSFVDSLAQVRGEALEANHSLAARTLLQKQKRRALVVWITDFAETPATPDVIESAIQISRRHLVLFAAVSQPDLAILANSIPQDETEMFRHTAAVEIAQRRELLLRNLRRNGILAMELPPTGLTSSLVNQYLEIKDRSLL